MTSTYIPRPHRVHKCDRRCTFHKQHYCRSFLHPISHLTWQRVGADRNTMWRGEGVACNGVQDKKCSWYCVRLTPVPQTSSPDQPHYLSHHHHHDPGVCQLDQEARLLLHHHSHQHPAQLFPTIQIRGFPHQEECLTPPPSSFEVAMEWSKLSVHCTEVSNICWVWMTGVACLVKFHWDKLLDKARIFGRQVGPKKVKFVTIFKFMSYLLAFCGFLDCATGTKFSSIQSNSFLASRTS